MSEYTDLKAKTYKIIQRVRGEGTKDTEDVPKVERERNAVEELYKIFLVEPKAK